MRKTISEKVEELNEFVGRGLGITHFVEWELSSYKPETFFSETENHIKADTFEEVINKAYAKMEEEIKRRCEKKLRGDIK